ncbi:MAG: choice-of-anchor tandem repeat GloVer-containing protein [Terriglobia bacterium]
MERKKAQWLKKASVACLLLAATAVGSPAQTFRSRVSFDGSNGAGPNLGSLVQDKDGNLYGTTRGGGAYDRGTVFKINREGTLTTLYSFCSQTDCTDGSLPQAELVLGADGKLYGTTYQGGAYCSPQGCGTVFKITREGRLTTLHSFDGTDGKGPWATLVEATDRNFYGTTRGGGAHGYGTVFKMTREGTLTTLHSFDITDGANAVAPLIEATDRNLYGTTWAGGAYHNYGTVFRITRKGTLTTLYSFCSQSGCPDGANPFAPLIQATDGKFYGTTWAGGANGDGTVFKITREGTLTTIHSFAGTDGAAPYGGLLLGADGKFYGTTGAGGVYGDGTVFKITREGTLTTLHSFDGTDGSEPDDGLLLGADGKFYGTTLYGGANGYGTVFSLTVRRDEWRDE